MPAPWGVAIAPKDFGQFSGELLVGNFSYLYSEINGFGPQTHKLVGAILIFAGSGNTPGGLWTLTFGGAGNDCSPNTLYFTDGVVGETHGLLGAIESVPNWGIDADAFEVSYIKACRRDLRSGDASFVIRGAHELHW